jgi:signal transduction histidine kinase
MEALGRLAGGIAHDFNNLLQAVINCCRSALVMLDEQRSPLAQTMLQMQRSAERGATLTRQLLAFSRQGELTLGLVDLDALLLDLEFLLRRLIGSSVDVELDRGAGCTVLADPGQLQQVIINLAINASDAMPDGGSLRVATRVVDLGSDDSPRRATLNPGKYAQIVVSDTGIGMDRATLDRIFGPYFTTKPVGRGSGLGLPMVYGIVQTLNGGIEVDSEPARGTSFRIYLPCGVGPNSRLTALGTGASLPTSVPRNEQ